jgi:hypothetical protein
MWLAENFDVVLLLMVWPSGVYSWWMTPSWLKKTFNVTYTLLQTWWVFLASKTWSLPLGSLGFCFQVIPADPRFVTDNYCLHEVCSWSAHCRKSLATARQVSFCLTSGSFGTDFAKMCLMPKSSVRMDCTKPN